MSGFRLDLKGDTYLGFERRVAVASQTLPTYTSRNMKDFSNIIGKKAVILHRIPTQNQSLENTGFSVILKHNLKRKIYLKKIPFTRLLIERMEVVISSV